MTAVRMAIGPELPAFGSRNGVGHLVGNPLVHAISSDRRQKARNRRCRIRLPGGCLGHPLTLPLTFWSRAAFAVLLRTLTGRAAVDRTPSPDAVP